MIYYQEEKKIQQKEIISTILIYLTVIFIFVAPKINYFIFNIQFRTDYLIYIIIFIFSLFFFSNNLKKNDFIIIGCFFLINFFLSQYEGTNKEFIKQFLLISFVYLTLKNYSKNFDQLKFIIIYKKIGFFIIILGYLIYIISLTQSQFFYKILNNTINYDNIFLEFITYAKFSREGGSFFLDFFQIKNVTRFQSICSEPATYSILVSPLLYFYLENYRKNLFKILLLTASVILSQSIYGMLGLLLSFVLRNRLNFKVVLLMCIIITFSLYLPGQKLQNLIYKSFSVFNVGFDENRWNNELKKLSSSFNKKMLIERFNKYNSEFYFPFTSEEEELIKNSYKDFYQRNPNDLINEKLLGSLIEKHSFWLYNAEFNIETSSCAYLSNLFIAISNLKKYRILGTGLGSHEIIYKKHIKEWKFMKANSAHCLALNYKDAKSYFIRVFSEFGLIGLLILLFLFIKLKNSNKDVEIFSKIIIFLLFLQTGNYGLLKINIFFLLILKNSNINNLFSKFQKNN